MHARLIHIDIKKATTRKQLADLADEARALVDDHGLRQGCIDHTSRRAAELGITRIKFGVHMSAPRFLSDGVWYRKRSLVIPDDSIELRFASPDAEHSPSPADVLEAWKLWKLDRVAVSS